MEVAQLKKEIRSAFQDTLVIHRDTSWLGAKAQKCPTDAWVYQELIHKLRPDFIIETGTAFGGGTMFLASMCDVVGRGRVVTIEYDTTRPLVPLKHERITQLYGSSIAPETIAKVREIVGDGTCLVILDSDHSYEHVKEEMPLYSQFVKKDFYLIVEDTHMRATAAAAQEFVENNSDYVVDEECEKFILTFNPGGFLKRIK